MNRHKRELADNGFSVAAHIYSDEEVRNILAAIESADTSKENFRKSNDLFAIRQFLKEVPAALRLILTHKLRAVIRHVLGDHFFVVRSIYFDKPATSNWHVPYHQDLTISVDKKAALEDFGCWTTKQGQFSVQPPIDVLENITTIRIHLDETDENNGALKVIPGSHLKKIYRQGDGHQTDESAVICNVKRGGIMLMKPLILHSSDKTLNHKKRRVIHVEFSDKELPPDIGWAERINLH